MSHPNGLDCRCKECTGLWLKRTMISDLNVVIQMLENIGTVYGYSYPNHLDTNQIEFDEITRYVRQAKVAIKRQIEREDV